MSIDQSGINNAIQPRVLLKPKSWLAKIDFINHLILFNNMLITVVSEKKGGKTSFGTLLREHLDPQIKSILLTAVCSCTRGSLIQQIATQLQLYHDEDTDLASLVAQINELKMHVLVLIDEAHYVPESFIKEAMLDIKDQKNFSFFHLCLLSDSSIVTTFYQLGASFFDNLINTIELGALTESETRSYVLHRAMVAHFITKPLTELQFKQFYQLTKGNIAKINNILEPFVASCLVEKKHNPYQVIKIASLAAGIAFIIGFLSVSLVQSSEFLPSFFEAITTTLHNETQLVTYIPSWQESSSRQLVYSSLPKRERFDDLEENLSNESLAIVDKVIVIPKLLTSLGNK